MKMQQNNKTGETSVVSTVVAAICIVIYLVSLVQAVVRLYLSVDKQKIQADYDFQSLGNIVTSSGAKGFMNEPFITSINNFLTSSNTIEAVIVFGPSVEYAFEKQRGATITWVNNTPRIINKFNIYTQGLYKTFPLDNIMNVSIQAAARVFNYSVISKILKETLIFILIGFAIAFFTMLLKLLLGNTEEAEAVETNESSPLKHEFSPVDIRLSEPVSVRVNEPVNVHIHETAKAPQSAEPISVRVNEPVNVHIETVQAPPPPIQTPPPVQAPSVQAPPPPVQTPPPPPPPVQTPQPAPSHNHAEPAALSEENLIDDGAGPKGLYSPRSHIGWEEYLNDRLDSELHRCASTEKDLTLLMLEFKDKITNFQFKDAAHEASSLFTTRDLLFEKGEQGISVIMPGVDLDTGLSKARKFQERIKEKLFSKSAIDDCAYIGLSSRAGRLLNADRLKLEANEALKKAKTDTDTSIIAFKSDLEKYRKFIASQNPLRS